MVMRIFFAIALASAAVVGATEEMCTVPGKGTGVCISTSTCSSRSGTSYPGYCPGSADIQCCVGMFCGATGMCMTTNECDGSLQSGLCPGDSTYKCCSNIPCSASGTCKPTSSCSGTIVSGLCPGGSNYKCCESGSTPPSGTCTFESSTFKNSKAIAAFFRAQGITDNKALATILGNLQQESSLNPLACEAYGGPASSLNNCPVKLLGSYWATGVGILQWSDPGNLPGRRTQFFNYCKTNKLNPDVIETQLQFLVQESQWNKASVKGCFQEAGKEIGSVWNNAGATSGTYFKCAAIWTGWGTAGNRAVYANRWYNQCVGAK